MELLYSRMEDDIRITNLSDDDVLSYSVVIIRGEVPRESCASVHMKNADAKDSNEFRVADRKFVALYQLKEGNNEIIFRGFDYFDRIFVQPLHFEIERPKFSRSSALRLRHHYLLQFEGEFQEIRAIVESKRKNMTTHRSNVPDFLQTGRWQNNARCGCRNWECCIL